MRLLNTIEHTFREFPGEDVPQYAILSHTWETEEVSYQDIISGTALTKRGYTKITQCCKRAAQDRIQYVWVDTCCINKESSAELSEAINSMYRWYYGAAVCYAYLADVDDEGLITESGFGRSRWFTRGWTLQELIAPQRLIFFSTGWHELASKDDVGELIARITGIHQEALIGCSPKIFTIAQRMSWAATRRTTRVEDMAYCLMGIFDVNMPLIYGEGQKAFTRLQTAILNESNDRSIFAWKDKYDKGRPRGLLATHPSQFAGSRNIVRRLESSPLDSEPYSITNAGLRIQFGLIPLGFPAGDKRNSVFYAPLNCLSADAKNISVLLKRISTESMQYGRVSSHQLQQLPRWHPGAEMLLTVCVRQDAQMLELSQENLPAHGAMIRPTHLYDIESLAPPQVWTRDPAILEFKTKYRSKGSMLLAPHGDKDRAVAVTFGLDKSERGLRILIKLASPGWYGLLSETLLQNPDPEPVVEAPEWADAKAKREIVHGFDFYVVEFQFDYQKLQHAVAKAEYPNRSNWGLSKKLAHTLRGTRT